MFSAQVLIRDQSSGVESTSKLTWLLTEFSSLQLQDCIPHLSSLAISQGSLSVLVPRGGPQVLVMPPPHSPQCAAPVFKAGGSISPVSAAAALYGITCPFVGVTVSSRLHWPQTRTCVEGGISPITHHFLGEALGANRDMSCDSPSASLIGEYFFSNLYTFNLFFLASLSLRAFSTTDRFDCNTFRTYVPQNTIRGTKRQIANLEERLQCIDMATN